MEDDWEVINKARDWITYKNKKTGLIREDYSYGLVAYYDENRMYHRLDGPAEIWSGKKCLWHYHGKHINCSSQEEFERLLRLKAFW